MELEREYRPVEILLVEDNPADVRLTREAFKEGKIRNHMSVVSDGVEAMAFLRRERHYACVPRPDIILLDLNLPKKDGRDVLAEIREEESLRHIPVVVLTTSNAEKDLLETYDLPAGCYIIKPVDFGRFVGVVKVIHDLWFASLTARRVEDAHVPS